MYTPIQLEAIKIFGRKDLTEGCLLQNKKSLIIYKHSWVNLNNKNIYYFDWYEHSYFYQDDLIFFEILWHIPELFPDVAQSIQAKWYNLELSKIDTIESVIKITRWDIKRPIKIPYRKLIPLLDQPSLPDIISLFK